MTNIATFCLYIFPINHLQNLRSYDIFYGYKLPAISHLQLEGDDLTRQPFYHFTDYLDPLNEWIHALHDIIKEHHNQTIQNRREKHGSKSPSLRSFNEGDIVYCHFPSKTIISDHNLPSKKLKMSNDGPFYIFSKHEKFLYLLATKDGEDIEQMFHDSHLKQVLLWLPNGKSVKNINDFKTEMVKLKFNPTRRVEKPDEGAADSSEMSVKSVLHIHHDESHTICHNTDIPTNWYDSTSIYQNWCFDRKKDLMNLYHAHHSVITSTDTLRDTVFSPDESLHGFCNFYTVSKCRFKFGNLQIFFYFSNDKPTH